MQDELRQLVDLCWKAVSERRDKLGGQAVARPPQLPLRDERVESRFGDAFAVLEQLRPALALARENPLAPLANSLEAVLEELRWSQNPSYDETNVSRELLDGYAYAGLSGPDSPIACEAPLCGFLLLGPRVTYKDHNHEPREIYMPLTPGSRWCLDSGDWFDVDAGDLILHGAWQMHAMRTADNPLLAFVAWLDAGDRSRISI